MKGQGKTAWKAAAVLFVTAALGLAQDNSLSAPAQPPAGQETNSTPAAAAQTAQPAGPGTVNYVEGTVALDGQPLSSKSVGNTALHAGQVISTRDGYVEVLLTPGAFLRLGHNGEAKLLSAGLADSQVDLTRGSSLLEVDQLIKGTNLSVTANGANTHIEKKGLYAFDAGQQSVRVLDGKAKVTVNGSVATLGKHDELLLSSDNPARKRSFDESTAKAEPLYVWSRARSEDESQASLHAASNATYYSASGPGWFWDPYYLSYGFWPVGGPLYSPFGWGFYSPAYFGFYGGGYYGAAYPGYFYGRPGWRGHDHDGWRGPGRVGGVNARVGGYHRGGSESFHSAGAAGGFHGGGGGFHGGGGGGFHGGGGGHR